MDSFGKKNGRIFGLGTVSRILIPSSKQVSTNSDEDLRSQIQALNESLQRQNDSLLRRNELLKRQELEKLEMKKELGETKNQLAALMQHLGFAASSSLPQSSPQHSSNEDEDEDSNHDHDDHDHFTPI